MCWPADHVLKCKIMLSNLLHRMSSCTGLLCSKEGSSIHTDDALHWPYALPYNKVWLMPQAQPCRSLFPRHDYGIPASHYLKSAQCEEKEQDCLLSMPCVPVHMSCLCQRPSRLSDSWPAHHASLCVSEKCDPLCCVSTCRSICVFLSVCAGDLRYLHSHSNIRPPQPCSKPPTHSCECDDVSAATEAQAYWGSNRCQWYN